MNAYEPSTEPSTTIPPYPIHPPPTPTPPLSIEEVSGLTDQDHGIELFAQTIPVARCSVLRWKMLSQALFFTHFRHVLRLEEIEERRIEERRIRRTITLISARTHPCSYFYAFRSYTASLSRRAWAWTGEGVRRPTQSGYAFAHAPAHTHPCSYFYASHSCNASLLHLLHLLHFPSVAGTFVTSTLGLGATADGAGAINLVSLAFVMGASRLVACLHNGHFLTESGTHSRWNTCVLHAVRLKLIGHMPLAHLPSVGVSAYLSSRQTAHTGPRTIIPSIRF